MKCVEALWATTCTPPWPQTINAKPKLSNFQVLKSSKRAQTAVDITATCESSVKTLVPLPSSNVKTITSTSNPFVKHCVKLRQSSSYRHSHGSVLVVGSTPIREIYNFQEETDDRSTEIECLLMLENADVPEGLDHSICVLHVSSAVMKKLSGVQSIDSIDMIALMRIPSTFCNVGDGLRGLDLPSWFSCPHRILVLDGIQVKRLSYPFLDLRPKILVLVTGPLEDPGNLGTLLRSALAFRWDGAYLLPGCCDPFNEKALRASRGAAFQLPIVSGGWKYLEALQDEFQMKMLAGHPANEGKSVYLLSQGFARLLLDAPLCLILGSEGSGLSKKTMRVCELVTIPMEGKFESLNVSVAGGIFLYMLQPENHECR